MASIRVKKGLNVISDDFVLSAADIAKLSLEYKQILAKIKYDKRFRTRRIKAKRLPRHKQSLAPVVYGLYSLNDRQYTKGARDCLSMRQEQVRYIKPNIIRSFEDQFGGHNEYLDL